MPLRYNEPTGRVPGNKTNNMRTTKVRLTAINNNEPKEWYFGTCLLLRKIRNVGDVEVVNNYQLGRMNEAKRYGYIDFEKVVDDNPFVDDMGANRHAMSYDELNELYKRLDNFIADCTFEEAKENRDAFVKVKTMIHQRMRETKK